MFKKMLNGYNQVNESSFAYIFDHVLMYIICKLDVTPTYH